MKADGFGVWGHVIPERYTPNRFPQSTARASDIRIEFGLCETVVILA